MDWNWFFSSVAQSIAALDGTLLAFVIATLLNNQSSHARRLASVSALIRHAERLRDAAAIRYFGWYNDQILEEALDDLSRRVRDEEARLSPDEYAARLDLPEYLPREHSIAAIGQKLRELDELAEEEAAAERRRSARPFAFDSISMLPNIPSPLAIQAQQMRTAAHRQELEAEREALRLLRVDVLDSIRNVKAAVTEISTNPEFSALLRRVLIASAALFLFAVIYPLSFLPVPNQWDHELGITGFVPLLFSLRGAILTLAVAVFGSLLIVLWQANERLRFPDQVRDDLSAWSEERAYSNYFEIWRANRTTQTSAPAASERSNR